MPNNKSYLNVIILLSLTLTGFVYIWQADGISATEIKLESIPLKLGEWQGEEILLSQRTLQILETKDALMRQYTNPQGERVILAIVYSALNRGAFHPPEVCYLGGGRVLLNKQSEKIELVNEKNDAYAMQVNKLLMQDSAGKELAWYWFTAGDRVTSSYYHQQLFFVWDKLRRNQPGGALVRVSIRANDDLPEAEAAGKDFIRQIAPKLSSYLACAGKSRRNFKPFAIKRLSSSLKKLDN